MPTSFGLPFDDEPRQPSGERPGEGQRPATDRPRLTSDDRRLTPHDARRILSVSELTAHVRDRIETTFADVWVEGEISNYRRWSTGHLYFTLKDATAQIRAVMFRSAARALTFAVEDGLHVIARGRLSVYEPKGEYQIVCEHLEPRGLGALQLAFEQLKKRLQAEGLFDTARKRPLPLLPRRIGIVTSLDGAALRDILKVLARRHAGVRLVVAPTRVQGDGAGAEIARALGAITGVNEVDVVIVGRGGGSVEDLWAFNEEVVARAIAASPVPVISAVGHEIDFTIADFVADLRAPTPSAAAEMAVAATTDFSNRVHRLRDRLAAAARHRIQAESRRVHVLASRPALAGIPARVILRGRHTADVTHALARAVRQVVASPLRRLQQASRRLDAADVGRRLEMVRTRLVTADGRLASAVGRRYLRADALLRGSAAQLDALSPLAVLGRGYAVCWDADRTRVLRAARDVSAGDRVRVTLARGELECDVRDTLDEAPWTPPSKTSRRPSPNSNRS